VEFAMRKPPSIQSFGALIFCSVLATATISQAVEEKNQATIPDYSEIARDKVPAEFKFRISDLFQDEAAWRAEKDRVAKLIASIPEAAQAWTATPKSMADLLDLVAAINEKSNRLYAYAKLLNDMDLSNPAFTTMQGEIQSMGVDLASKSTFIGPDVLKLGETAVAAAIKSEPRLAPHRFDLLNVMRRKNHVLSEIEGGIVAKVGLFTGTDSKVAGLLRDVEMPNAEVTLSNGNKVVLNDSNYLKYRIAKKKEDRKIVAEAYWKNMSKFQSTYAALLDGEMKKQISMARIQRFDSALDSALFDDDIRPEVYHNLIRTVKGNVAPLHRLIRLKQKMLGLEEMHYYDVAVPAAPVVETLYGFDDARKLVLASMAPLGESYHQTLEGAFENRWIDIYPNQGKQSGAYSMGVYGIHPFIKLNYQGRYSDVSTLTHELGHSMHSHFACSAQPNTTAGYSTFIAEIASTFNENLLLNHMLKSGTDARVKLGLLESYLERMRGTIYAQTMLAEFELAIHERVEQGQTLTAEWLNQTYFTLYRHYYGVDQGVIHADEIPAITWAAIPHLFRPYYVFQYVTGMVASTALAESVTQGGKPEAGRYLNMLRAGGSKFPLEILKDAGVDMTTPHPIEASLKQFDRLVGEMEVIYAHLAAEEK
jgi:oligoendopeptidase F